MKAPTFTIETTPGYAARFTTVTLGRRCVVFYFSPLREIQQSSIRAAKTHLLIERGYTEAEALKIIGKEKT